MLWWAIVAETLAFGTIPALIVGLLIALIR